MSSLDLAVIGNCQIASLIDRNARVVWSCFPRLDSDPAFCSLLNDESHPETGLFEIEMIGFQRSEQEYLRNTPILQTTLYDHDGNALRITDFAPRFQLYGRIYRPNMLIRTLAPVIGLPRIRIRLRPAVNYGRSPAMVTHGSNHIRYQLEDITLRLTTDASLTSVLEETPFVLAESQHLVLGPDEPVLQAVDSLAREHFGQTRAYWESWVRGLAIPFEWQAEVIRAAITLKLCTYEDTGAVVAAITTSIPEAANSGRNWDYRYCWLRDSYFVVQALNSLGATRTMQAYLGYILNVSLEAGSDLQPVYSITGNDRLDESVIDHLPGYRGMGPVRVGNQAFEQVQNDVYGAVILASTQYFFDTRLRDRADPGTFERLEALGHRAAELYDKPDAGIWEYRGRQRVHTFSALMCWAACDRLARIAARIGKDGKAVEWGRRASQIHKDICENAWNDELNAFTESFGQPEMDAALLTIPTLGFLPADDPRFLGTLAAVEKTLRNGNHLMRYKAADDFGEPENAFNICTFWYIEALAATGRRDEARELFEKMLEFRNHLGLLSEDLDPTTGELWGNFPQTYSMVGIINSARRLSRQWEDAL